MNSSKFISPDYAVDGVKKQSWLWKCGELLSSGAKSALKCIVRTCLFFLLLMCKGRHAIKFFNNQNATQIVPMLSMISHSDLFTKMLTIIFLIIQPYQKFILFYELNFFSPPVQASSLTQYCVTMTSRIFEIKHDFRNGGRDQSVFLFQVFCRFLGQSVC